MLEDIDPQMKDEKFQNSNDENSSRFNNEMMDSFDTKVMENICSFDTQLIE